MEGDLIDGFAVLAEGVQVGVAEPRPVSKLDAQLEGALGLADHIVFVDPEQSIEGPDRRDGRFADSPRADPRRFDGGDFAVVIFQPPRESRGSHPTGRAAADDQNAANPVIGHGGTRRLPSPAAGPSRRDSRCILHAGAPPAPRAGSSRESAGGWRELRQGRAGRPAYRNAAAIDPDPSKRPTSWVLQTNRRRI